MFPTDSDSTTDPCSCSGIIDYLSVQKLNKAAVLTADVT